MTVPERNVGNVPGSLLDPPSDVSSLEETDPSEEQQPSKRSSHKTASAGGGEQPEFDPFGDPGSGQEEAPPSVPEKPATDPGRSKAPSMASKPPSHAARERGQKRRRHPESRGTFEEDHAYRERRMQHMLDALEVGQLKPTPIFPQSVLGHLYVRKFGLSKEQRAQIIRATNGSSRLRDVERIMRASDLEERRPDSA